MTYNSTSLYSEAVDLAASNVLSDHAASRKDRARQLTELLYSLGTTIPESWQTSARKVLYARERSIDRILNALSKDVGDNPYHLRYQVLSSVLLLALTVKQFSGGNT